MNIFYFRNNQRYIKWQNAHHIKYLDFNRGYGPRKDLQDSMNTYGVTSTISVIKTDILGKGMNYYIADGQNRIKTAIELKEDIPVFIVEYDFRSKVELVQYISKINVLQKVWTTANYIHSYCCLGFSHYEKLKAIKDGSTFSTNTIASLLMVGKCNRKLLASGSYVIDNLENGIRTLKFATKMTKYIKVTSKMLLALKEVMLHDNFNAKKFEANLEKYARTIPTSIDVADYKRMFARWLNSK